VPKYWIDSSVFITAKDTMYAFDINSSFWAWMDKAIRVGDVGAPSRVFKEVVESVVTADELATWVKSRKKNGLCIEPNTDVISAIAQINRYVFKSGRYEYKFAMDFMRQEADSWIIASAMGYGGEIVTQETELGPASHHVRIPDVANHFGIRCKKVWDMLRDMKASL
jgi:hypothetical protein